MAAEVSFPQPLAADWASHPARWRPVTVDVDLSSVDIGDLRHCVCVCVCVCGSVCGGDEGFELYSTQNILPNDYYGDHSAKSP